MKAAKQQNNDQSINDHNNGILDENGDLCWFNSKGKLHRIDGPAKITAYGVKEYWINGRRHRDVGPAVEGTNGALSWYKDGKFHRDNAPAVITSTGDNYWYVDGKLHRLDGPAIHYSTGEGKWYKNGASHREGGPAVDLKDRKEYWINGKQIKMSVSINTEEAKIDLPSHTDENGQYWKNKNGEIHRDNGPAIIWANGTKEWKKNDKTHREDGPAIIHASGAESWYINGILHREDGPAVIYEGYTAWYRAGKLHRTDGPAIERLGNRNEWYLWGEPVSESEFIKRMNLPAHNGSTSNSWIGVRRENIENSQQMPKSETEKTSTTAATSTAETKPQKKEAKNWPDEMDTLLPYEEIYAPLKQVLEDGYHLRRKDPWTFPYDGYDISKLEKREYPSVHEQLTEKFLQSEKKKVSVVYPQGISLCDIIMRIMFQMGLEQGRRMAYQETYSVDELHKVLDRYREKQKDLRYELAKSKASLNVLKNNPDKDQKTLDELTNRELEETRKLRVEEIKNDLRLDPSKSLFKSSQKRKAKLSGLIGLAASLDPEIVKIQDWISILNEAGSSMKEWKSFCRKKQFTKFVSE